MAEGEDVGAGGGGGGGGAFAIEEEDAADGGEWRALRVYGGEEGLEDGCCEGFEVFGDGVGGSCGVGGGSGEVVHDEL